MHVRHSNLISLSFVAFVFYRRPNESMNHWTSFITGLIKQLQLWKQQLLVVIPAHFFKNVRCWYWILKIRYIIQKARTQTGFIAPGCSHFGLRRWPHWSGNDADHTDTARETRALTAPAGCLQARDTDVTVGKMLYNLFS